MALKVEEVMNRELASVRASTEPEVARQMLLMFGITALAVVDEQRRPIGVVSMRDLAGDFVELPVHTPAMTVHAHETIDKAAHLLAETDYHHLVVVDDAGRAVGMVSAVDLLRAMLGMPARHPAAFPHFDLENAVTWTDDSDLELTRVDAAPDAPGVLVLIRGGRGIEERVVWAEACDNIRARLVELVSVPADSPALARILRVPGLRFRAAALRDASRRKALAQQFADGYEHPPMPAGASVVRE